MLNTISSTAPKMMYLTADGRLFTLENLALKYFMSLIIGISSLHLAIEKAKELNVKDYEANYFSKNMDRFKLIFYSCIFVIALWAGVKTLDPSGVRLIIVQ